MACEVRGVTSGGAKACAAEILIIGPCAMSLELPPAGWCSFVFLCRLEGLISSPFAYILVLSPAQGILGDIPEAHSRLLEFLLGSTSY